jgi:2-polyprenyl-3-methyl-5-hydroxy-6-metoxy-1,4-benzoquinol methylase
LCLDLGCGDGSLSRFLAEKRFKTVGIDQSEAMLSIARRKAVENGIEGYAEYIRASLPLSGDLEGRYLNSAHVILCSSVLEYLANPEDVLCRFDRLLAPGGILLISFPNRFSFYRVCEQALSGILNHTDSYVRHQRHPLTLPHVKQVLNRIGFTMIDETFFALPFQRYTEWLFGSRRGNRVATMVLLVAKKRS